MFFFFKFNCLFMKFSHDKILENSLRSKDPDESVSKALKIS